MAGRTILERGQDSEEKELTVLVQVYVEVLLGLELADQFLGGQHSDISLLGLDLRTRFHSANVGNYKAFRRRSF